MGSHSYLQNLDINVTSQVGGNAIVKIDAVHVYKCGESGNVTFSPTISGNGVFDLDSAQYHTTMDPNCVQEHPYDQYILLVL